MIQALIIDDEPKARSNLKNLLETHCPDVKVVDEAGNVKNSLKAIDQHEPDLLFLDIKMQNETAFDLLESLEDADFEIIFVTAYDEYVIKAIRFSALDYLLKPIDIDKLKEAVQRVKEKKETTHEKFEHLLRNLRGTDKTFNKIALPTMEGQVFIELGKIIRCESEDNYTRFFIKDHKPIMVSKTIKHFESLLEDHHFFRVHQSHLVNLKHVNKYVKGKGGYIIMEDDSDVPVSKRRKKPFLDKLSTLQ
jgi:two-component system LytT family response regulator